MLQEKVKTTLAKVCKKLPESISEQCTQFVDLYGDAIVAILAQEIDPSQVSVQVYYKLLSNIQEILKCYLQVCSMLHLCPDEKLMKMWQSIPKKYMLEEVQNKPSCPLCLLAVTQIYDVIKNNKTEVTIIIILFISS